MTIERYNHSSDGVADARAARVGRGNNMKKAIASLKSSRSKNIENSRQNLPLRSLSPESQKESEQEESPGPKVSTCSSIPDSSAFDF